MENKEIHGIFYSLLSHLAVKDYMQPRRKEWSKKYQERELGFLGARCFNLRIW